MTDTDPPPLPAGLDAAFDQLKAALWAEVQAPPICPGCGSGHVHDNKVCLQDVEPRRRGWKRLWSRSK